MDIRRNVISGLSWTAGGNLLGQLITWTITIVVMRILAPSDYGLLAIASIFVALLTMLAAAGLGPAIVQAKAVGDALLRQLFGLILGMNLLLFCILFTTAPAIASFFSEPGLSPVVRALACQFIINAFATIPEALLGRELRFKARSLIDLGANVAGGVLTLVLALQGAGVWSLVGGSLLTAVCKAVGLNLCQPYLRLPAWSLAGTRAMLTYGGNVTAARLLWFFYSQADMFIAGKLLGKEVVGFYSVAMHLASLPVQKISGVLNQVAFPAFAKVQDDRNSITGHVLKGVRLLAFFAFPVLWGISAVASDLVGLLLGEKWQAAVLPLQILPAIMPLRMISNFLPAASDAVGRPDVSVKNLISASIVMPTAFVIGSQWGVPGLCLSWLIAFPLVFAGNLMRLLPVLEIPIRSFASAIWRPALAAGGMFAAVMLAASLMPASLTHGLRLGAEILVGAGSYLGLSAAFNRHGTREVLAMLKRGPSAAQTD